MSGIELFTIAGQAVTLGDAALAAGTLVGTVGAISSGQAQARAAQTAAAAQAQSLKFQAQLAENETAQLQQRAGQERAAGQHAAIEERRQGRFVTSRAQSVAAASGAGALDPTIVNILGDIGQETEVRALTQLATGEESARGLEFGAGLQRAGAKGNLFAADVARITGAQEAAAARRAGLFGAAGTLLSGASSLFDRFGQGGPANMPGQHHPPINRFGFLPSKAFG